MRPTYSEQYDAMIPVLKGVNEAVKSQENNDARYVGQKLVDILLGSDKLDLSDLELGFRETDSRVHLLALPIEVFPGYKSFYPGSNQDCLYALWICMNGAKEAEETLNRHNLTKPDNLVQLHSCGFLTPEQ